MYFAGIFEQRFSPVKSICIGLLLFSMCSGLNLLSHNNTTLNLCTSLLATTLFSLICFHGTIAQDVFFSIVLVVLNTTLEAIVLSLSTFITGNAFLDYNNDVLLFLFEAVSSKGAYYLVVLVIVRIINPVGTASKVPLTFMAYPITSTFCLFVFWRISVLPDFPSEVQLLMIVAAGFLFVSSILLFISYSRQVEKDCQSMQIQSELARLQTEQSYYQILDQQNQQLMIYAHDAKKHLGAIQALNNDPQISSYVKKLSEQLADYTRNCHSGNKLLDVMLHKYTIDCEMRGIQFKYDVKVCNLSQLDDIDLVAILGNLLDNAVTAAEKSAEKTVSLNTVHRNSYSIIILSNSCDTAPKKSGSRLISTKSDTSLHGFGLKSVEKTIRKYQGDYEWAYNVEKKLFTVTVMIADKG